MGSHIMPPLGAINPNHIPAALLTSRSGRARQFRPGVGADPRVRPVFHDLPPVEFDVDEPVWSSAEFPHPPPTPTAQPWAILTPPLTGLLRRCGQHELLLTLEGSHIIAHSTAMGTNQCHFDPWEKSNPAAYALKSVT